MTKFSKGTAHRCDMRTFSKGAAHRCDMVQLRQVYKHDRLFSSPSQHCSDIPVGDMSQYMVISFPFCLKSSHISGI